MIKDLLCFFFINDFITMCNLKKDLDTCGILSTLKHLSCLLAFLNNWLNFRVRGQFEIKMLIVLGHSDINTTYFI